MAEGFIYANGRISGQEETLLDHRMWQMLINAADEAEVLRFLGDTWYGRFMQHHALEGCFIQAMTTTEDELLELSEDPRLVRGILHRRDVRNARYIWKEELIRGESGGIDLERPGLLPLAVLSRAVREDEARDELPDSFGEALDEILSAEKPLESDIDRIMDRLASRVEMEELPFIGPGFRRFLRDRLEQKNYLTAGRSRQAGLTRQETEGMFLEGGYHTPEEISDAYQRNSLAESLAETPGFEVIAAALGEALAGGSFHSYSRECERYLLQMLDKGSFPVFGPSPLAAFVIRREMEIGHLRLIVAAKAVGVPVGRLQDRLPRG